MAKPDLEDGYLRIAHELFAALACAGFNKWEWVVIREVLNQIYGPRRRKTATISPTEIAKEVSTHRQSIARASSTLVEAGVLAKVGDMEYRFIKDYEAWKNNGKARLNSFEGSYCGKAKTINASTQSVNKGAYNASTQVSNNGADTSTKHVNKGADAVSAGAYECQQGRLQTSAPALTPIPTPPDPPKEEPARGIEKRERENVCKTHTLEEFETGRTGEEHRLFEQVVNELQAHKPTSHLAKSLIEAAEIPDIRNLPSWRLLVAARAVQQPNKGKDWPLFRSIAQTCRRSEYETLRRLEVPVASQAGPATPAYFKGSPDLLHPPRKLP